MAVHRPPNIVEDDSGPIGIGRTKMRDRILSEIRRLAMAKDGQAPGRVVFERETGIRKSEWLGVYWARWGDALQEAGFSPNEFQGQADLDEMFDALSHAVRFYKKLPTSAELRIYGRTNADLPSLRNLENRFRNKTDMLGEFKKWLSAHNQYIDVLELLPEGEKASADRSIISLKEGFVYLISSGRHYKIGRSDEIERRVKEIRIALPEAATLVHTIRTDDPAGIEAYWHRRFADKRANGEWFNLSSQDVTAFKRRKYQ